MGKYEKNWEIGKWVRGKREHTVPEKVKGGERKIMGLERQEEKTKELTVQ